MALAFRRLLLWAVAFATHPCGPSLAKGVLLWPPPQPMECVAYPYWVVFCLVTHLQVIFIESPSCHGQIRATILAFPLLVAQ